MKPVLFILGAVAALVVSPALAQQTQISSPPPPQFFDYGAQAQAYPSGQTPRTALQCFDGQRIKAVSRSGERTLLVQNGSGVIYSVQLRENCPAADQALKVSAMAGRNPAICNDDTAVLFLRTPAGPKRCRIADVQRLSSGEVAAVSPTPRR